MAEIEPVSKFIRDPVHDIIRIHDRFVLDLIDTAAMQRLRRVRQLGLAWLVYPGAEHSRFTHSLGAYHLAGRVMHQLEDEHAHRNNSAVEPLFGDVRRAAVLAAALLHDVGHGPFSHAFEHTIGHVSKSPVSHETWTRRIIDENAEIRQALEEAGGEDVVTLVEDILAGVATPHFMSAIVSSQLDVDRIDYVLRDSHMTGCRYGRFDLEWMLRTLAVRPVRNSSGNDKQPVETIVVDGRRGLDGLEAQLVGRHYMYRHVYFHKAVRAAECVLRSILQRAATLVADGKPLGVNDAFRKLATGRADDVSTSEYLSLDDFVILSWIEDWARTDVDGILRDLCHRLIARHLFKAIIVPPTSECDQWQYANNREAVQRALEKRNYDPAYYFARDRVQDTAYKDFLYNFDQGGDPIESEIWYLDSASGPPRPLSSFHNSVVIQARNALHYYGEYWFVPEDVAGDPDIAEFKWR